MSSVWKDKASNVQGIFPGLVAVLCHQTWKDKFAGILGKRDPFKKKKMAGMEGAALSGILNILANKLAPLVIKQYSSIVGVTKDLQDLQVLVQVINCWLEKAGYEAVESDQLWLRQLKHVAYDVDDIVDECHLEAEKHEANGGNHILSKSLITKARSFLLKCKAARKIQAIKERFAAIVKQRTDFTAIVNSLPDGHPVPHINRTVRAIPTLPTVDETSVHGRDQEKHEIISKLADNNNQHIIKIVSVIGLGGCGKTTLAKLVFNDGNIVKEHFEVRVWVHVSQEFDVEKLVKKLFEAISGEKSECCSLQKMAETISNKLTGKRYLLVLDDVWTEDRIQWEEFMVHVKCGAPGSSILLTTRSIKVAEAVESTEPFNLPFLSEVDCWAVFCQSFGMTIEGLDSEFLEVGRVIVNRCGGVPLAVKVLAGVLRDKKRVEEWKAMRDSNLLDADDREQIAFGCLKLSYFHLPCHLKQCFTICSLFPKGHRIYKEQLIELWIAHDMISLTPGFAYLEDIGAEHFSSLVQVSFLQDVAENDGRVICKMHDLVHDLAQSIMREEISTNVQEDAASSTKGYRYFSLIERPYFSLIERPRKPLPKRVFKNARSIYVDEGWDIISEDLENAKHLRSIIVKYEYCSAELMAIFKIKNLKYLEISGWHCESLPEAISDIWSLQAVHLINNSLLELPKSIGKLQKLRTLNLSGGWKLESLPDSIVDCTMLSSIVLSKCTSFTALPKSIGKLQKLRTLNLSHSTKLKSLPDSIGDCNMLTSIDLSYCKNLAALPNSIGRIKNLRVLQLGGTEIEKLPSRITTLRSLECLDLRGCSKLVELPEGIGNLKKLQVLNLENCSKLVELPEGIINLERLQVLNLECCRNLVELPKGIGMLEKLQVLNLKLCEALRGMPVGIGQLSRLEKLSLFVVGEGEKFAGISELANVGRDSEGLIIRGIEHVLEQDDAHKACLKWKKNLRSLKLEWERYHKGEVNTELEEAVLDGVEPPPGIKELEISGYSGRKYARWMHNQVGGEVKGLACFQFLRVMKLSNFLKLKHLDGLVELPCLWKLELHRMPSLESISGGPFPLLENLKMVGLHSLDEVWMVAGRTMSYGEEEGSCSNCAPHLGQVQVGNCLTYLDIIDCPKLKMKTFLCGHLTHWELTEGRSYSGHSRLWRNGRDWLLGQHVLALESFDILFSDALTEVPESLGSLTSLQSLSLSLRKLPECLGAIGSLQKLSIWNCNNLSSLPQSMGQLTSLQVLEIKGCPALHQLPECLGELSSLRTLHVEGLCNIKSFPQSLQHLTSLQYLTIVACRALHELPGGLGDLRSLCELNIHWLQSMTCFPESMFRLTSLKKLCVGKCRSLTSLPHVMEGMASLENILISRCRGIKSLPEGIKDLTSLKELMISACPGIKSLPKGIKGLTALKELVILGCPDLARRCKRGNGEDWHLISHIPHVRIYQD
ncbi:hypothetical protein U9M48_005445 [Paspalum notatum var. saurae]|uniref:Uncharacterized protein n=1 Tax=Paspalum notatum var. saurae TaxID=547442 RepID=A0AAQ3PXM8_PASNO